MRNKIDQKFSYNIINRVRAIFNHLPQLVGGSLFILMSYGCHQETEADKVYLNANIYTVDSSKPYASAMAVKADTILAIGNDQAVDSYVGPTTKVYDMKGQFIMPGFIEGHGHFQGLGKSLVELNLLKTRSWQQVEHLVDSVASNTSAEWIVGRGWHQEKWDSLPQRHVEGYPHTSTMDIIAKDRPVMLKHASGHALFANTAAMEKAGVILESDGPDGGRIVRDETGQPIGIFEETAMQLIEDEYDRWYNDLSASERRKIELKEVEKAQLECLRNGVTSFQDAGSNFQQIELYRELSENDQLDLRLWVMLRDSFEEMRPHMGELPYIKNSNKFFTCRAIKSEIDGALGSYGAWLLQPYNDKPGYRGQNTTPLSEVEKIAQLAKDNDMQLCVHAIGDRGNRVILDLMEQYIGPKGHQYRWRIEHAQHLHPNDIERFSNLGIIASMQAVHCTSDAPFVTKRLGFKRAKEGAYVWKSLLRSGAIVSNGTDAPVEDVDPLKNLYASVSRRRTDDGMVFFKEQSISREEAIHSMTMACAYAAYEENEKGSLSPGKLADFIIVDTDLVGCQPADILKANILATYVGGKLKYSHPSYKEQVNTL